MASNDSLSIQTLLYLLYYRSIDIYLNSIPPPHQVPLRSGKSTWLELRREESGSKTQLDELEDLSWVRILDYLPAAKKTGFEAPGEFITKEGEFKRFTRSAEVSP